MKIRVSIKKTIINLIVFLITAGIIILIVIYPTHQAHNAIKEYLKIFITWPGVILILSLVLLRVIRLILFHETKTEFIETGTPDITGFINIIGRTKDGDIIIKDIKKNKIVNGDAAVNEAFIMKYYDNQKEIIKLKKELKKYQDALLKIRK